MAACRQGYITSSAEAEELNSCSQGFSCRYSSTAPPVASTTHQKLAVDFDHPSQLLVLSVWISWRIISSEACWLVWINTVYHHLVRLSICTRNWISSIRSSILSYSVLFSKSVILNSWCTVFWGCNISSYQVDWITWNPDTSCKKLEVQQLRIILKQCASVAVDQVEFCELLCFFLESIIITASFLLQFEQFEIQLTDQFHICSSSEWQCDYCCRFNLHKTSSAQQLIAVTVTWILTIAPALVTCDSQTCDWYSTDRSIDRKGKKSELGGGGGGGGGTNNSSNLAVSST